MQKTLIITIVIKVNTRLIIYFAKTSTKHKCLKNKNGKRWKQQQICYSVCKENKTVGYQISGYSKIVQLMKEDMDEQQK